MPSIMTSGHNSYLCIGPANFMCLQERQTELTKKSPAVVYAQWNPCHGVR